MTPPTVWSFVLSIIRKFIQLLIVLCVSSWIKILMYSCDKSFKILRTSRTKNTSLIKVFPIFRRFSSKFHDYKDTILTVLQEKGIRTYQNWPHIFYCEPYLLVCSNAYNVHPKKWQEGKTQKKIFTTSQFILTI